MNPQSVLLNFFPSVYIVQDHTTSLWIKNNTFVKESSTQISVNQSNTKMDEKITIHVRVTKCRNSKCSKLGFSHVLEQYLDRCMKDHYKKTSSLWSKVNASVHESNNSIDEVI